MLILLQPQAPPWMHQLGLVFGQAWLEDDREWPSASDLVLPYAFLRALIFHFSSVLYDVGGVLTFYLSYSDIVSRIFGGPNSIGGHVVGGRTAKVSRYNFALSSIQR